MSTTSTEEGVENEHENNHGINDHIHALDKKQQAAVDVLARAAGPVFSKPYKGDLFGTRTNSIDGMLYLSRITVKDQLKNNIPTPLHAAPADTALPKHLDNPGQHMNEVGYREKKRQCAKTFERMIYSRLTPTGEFGSHQPREKGMKALLDNGIVPALISLATVPDVQTQCHCAKAFYGLSQVSCTRRLLVVNGIVGTIALLVRHGDTGHNTSRNKIKQDLAAIIAHITEESFLEDKMLHDGVDRVLTKLYQGHNSETKRIIALAFFNISHNSGHLKHCIDVFTQCITTVCKTMNQSNHPNKAALYLIKALFNLTQNQGFHNALISENAHRMMATPLLHYCKCHQSKSKPTDSVEDEAIEYGLKGLFMLSLMKNGRQHIVQDNLVSCIVSCLGIGGIITDTVCGILFQLSQDDGCREAIVSEIRCAVAFVHECSSYGYFTLSWVFRNLCASKAIYPALVDSGVVPILMQMSRDTHEEIKLNGISCMCCLLQCDLQLSEATSCMERIILDLVQLLQSSEEPIVIFAITALFNLTCNDSLQEFLHDPATGIIVALRKLLGPSKPTEKVTIAILPLIYQLSYACRGLMLQLGYFEFIASAIVSTNGAARHAALDTMLHLTLEAKDFPQGTDEVRALMKSLYTLKTNSDTIALRSCVSLLAHLTSTPKNKELLLKTGCALCLARICNTVDDFIMSSCAYILYCFTDTIEAVEIIVREEAIPVLIQLSRASNDHVKELCILSFCRISSHPNMETKLVEQGAIAASMIMALVATKSDQIKTLCVKIISNCLCLQSKHCTRTMVEHGVFWALSSLANLPFTDTRNACATCFCNLSSSYPLKMIEAGVPRALVQLVESGDGQTIVIALQAIANLLGNDKAIYFILVNEGIVKILRRLVDDSNNAVAIGAAMVLLQTSRADDKCRIESLRNGLLSWMLTILHENSLATQAILTLSDCTANSNAQKYVDATQTMDILRTAVDSTIDRQRLCVQALYNLTCLVPSLLHLVQAGAHTFLQEILHSPSTDDNLVNLCVVSLYNLTCVDDETALSTLVTSGLTKVLHSVYLFDTALNKTWCVLSICNLALGKVNSSRIVMENGGVVLIDYVHSSPLNEELYHTIALAFRKLINPPGNQKPMVDLGVVSSFAHLLRKSTAYAVRMYCLDSLAILTRNKENIWKSLTDGVLESILDIVDLNEAQSVPDHAIGTLCFTVLSNICAVDFHAVPQHSTRNNINVVSYLTRLSEYGTTKKESHSTIELHTKLTVNSKLVSILPTEGSNIPTLSPTYTVAWGKCYADNRPGLPPPIGSVWSPVNISVFTKNLPDSFKLPRYEILEKETLVRNYNDSSEAAHRYVVGIKGLVRLQVQAHTQVMLGLRRKKLQSQLNLDGVKDTPDRPSSGHTQKSSEASSVLPHVRLKDKRSSSLKYLVGK